MQSSNFSLRLPKSLLLAVRQAAEADGVSANQFIVVALAEKTSVMRATDRMFAKRAARADVPRALAILEKAGRGNPPMRGDALPKTRTARSQTKKAVENVDGQKG